MLLALSLSRATVLELPLQDWATITGCGAYRFAGPWRYFTGQIVNITTRRKPALTTTHTSGTPSEPVPPQAVETLLSRQR